MKAINVESDRHEGSTFEYPVHIPFNHPHPFDPTAPLLALHQHQPSRPHHYPPAYTHLPPSAPSPLDPHASSHSFPPPHPRPLQTQSLPQAAAFPVDMPYSRHPSTPPQPASAVESQLRRVPFSDRMADRRLSLDTPRISHLPEDHYHPHPAMAADYPHPSELDRPFDPSLQYASSMLASQTNAQRRKAVRATQACDGCRQKKAKCDEARPKCSSCTLQDIPCVYRDVPPPKQEKTMNDLKSMIVMLHDNLVQLRQDVHAGFASFGKPVASLPPLSNADEEEDQSSDGSNRDGKRVRTDSVLSPGHSQSRFRPPSPAPPQDCLNGVLSIPIEHTTAAHKLLSLWPSIDPFYDKVQDKNYVMRDESRRGLLRIFGRGEGHDGADRAGASRHPRSPSVSSDGGSALLGTDGFWGTGLPPSSTTTGRPFSRSNAGGLDGSGRLDLQATTVRRLLKSYLENMHILHPFLARRKLMAMAERFIARYSATPVCRPTSHSAGQGTQVDANADKDAVPRGKRKRSLASMSDAASSSNAGNTTAWPALEHSIETALILLILALGKICEHKDPLPPPLADKVPIGGAMTPSQSSSARSPSGLHSPIHPLAQSIDSTRFLTNGNRRVVSGSPASSFDSSPTSAKADDALNVDVIPGLAYYGQAVGILGELHGGNELLHVQAFLLAGLYMGQLARVFESWSWIYSAGTAIQILLKQDDSAATEEYKDSIRLAYWTCLQLESDVLAELDLPHSGISRLEDTTSIPKGLTLDPDSPEDDTNMVYYLAQIHLRRLLNRAHTALYDSGRTKLRNAGWSMLNASDLAVSLDEWRSQLPEQLKWDDADPPAADINAARMRAKYYGARYIIHRPFLHHALHKTPGPSEGLYGPDDAMPHMPDSMRSQNMIDLCRKCIEAAKASTVAFDGVKGRLIVTNIFGTAHAQFGNMLVLAATYRSENLSYLVSRSDIDALMDRTIRFLRGWAPLSPTLRTNVRILENARRLITEGHSDASFSDDTVYSGHE